MPSGGDGPRRRVAAALLGGSGTVVILLAYQAVPQMLTTPSLTVRQPEGTLFLLWVFTVGAAGGWVGHRMFLDGRRPGAIGSAPTSQMRVRAAWVGAATGLGVAVVGWTVAFAARALLFPFEPFFGMERMMLVWLRNASVAGPLAGAVISLGVLAVLKRGASSQDRS